MRIFFCVFLSFIICLPLMASAQKASFSKQQQQQEAIIRKAYKSGKVSAKEYHKLLREQQIIKETIAKANADGYLSPEEKNKIHSKLHRAKKRLVRYKNNNEIY